MLTITGLDFSYRKGQPLLHQFGLSMAAGDLLGLLGPNGAGKTTLVSLITGILRPKAGQILINGEPARLGRNDVALVPQEYAFYERLTARENLLYFAGVLGMEGRAAKTAVNNALGDCRLREVADQRAGQYSGGLKRRLNFAIALLQQPRLLILDEPTANVDPHSRSFLLELIRQQNRAGTSVIYTSHLLDEVQALCNRVAVMDCGRLLMQGKMETLLAENARLLTVELDQPLTDRQIAQLRATVIDDLRVQFDLAAAQQSPAQLLHELERAGLAIRKINYGERRLEELFFELTHRDLRD